MRRIAPSIEGNLRLGYRLDSQVLYKLYLRPEWKEGEINWIVVARFTKLNKGFIAASSRGFINLRRP